MKRVVPPRSLSRKDSGNATPLIVTNKCPDTIHPGITTQAGGGPEKTGFKLDPGESSNQFVSENWQGRVWGRTNCSFNDDGTGPANNCPGQACGTGDCNGVLDCKVTVRITAIRCVWTAPY